jgi:hypothetical protein
MTTTAPRPAYSITTGDRVTGRYMGDFEFAGTVTSARKHTLNHRTNLIRVLLDAPVTFGGIEHKGVFLEVGDDGTDRYGSRIEVVA